MNIFDQLEKLLSHNTENAQNTHVSERLQKTMEDLQRAFTNQTSAPQRKEVKTWTEEKNKQEESKKITDLNLVQAQKRFSGTQAGTSQQAQALIELRDAERDSRDQNKRVEDASRELERAIKDLAKSMKDATLRGPLASREYKETFQRLRKQEEKELSEKKSIFGKASELYEGLSGGRKFVSSMGEKGGVGEVGTLGRVGGAAGAAVGVLEAGYKLAQLYYNIQNRIISGGQAIVNPLVEASPTQKAEDLKKKVQETLAKLQKGESLGPAEQQIRISEGRLQRTGRAAEIEADWNAKIQQKEALQQQEVAKREIERARLHQEAGGSAWARAVRSPRMAEIGRALVTAKTPEERAAAEARVPRFMPNWMAELEYYWSTLGLQGNEREEKKYKEEIDQMRRDRDKAVEQQRKIDAENREAERKSGDLNASSPFGGPYNPDRIFSNLRGSSGALTDLERASRVAHGEPWTTRYGRDPRFD